MYRLRVGRGRRSVKDIAASFDLSKELENIIDEELNAKPLTPQSEEIKAEREQLLQQCHVQSHKLKAA